MQKLKILIQDIFWTWTTPPYTWITGIPAVIRLFIWHLLLKKVTHYFVGTFHGFHFLFDTLSDGCAQAFITPHYDYAQQQIILKLLGRQSIFIDVGANVGTETLLALKKGARVYAFEPTELSFNHLLINISLNQLQEHFVAVPQALSDRNGQIDFFAFDDGLALKNSAIKSDPKQMKISVPSLKLDDYMSQEKIGKVDLLKIDVEGAELLVLKGAQKALEKQQVVSISWESNHMADISTRKKTREYLSRLGYDHFAYDPQKQILIPYTNEEDCLSIHQKYVKSVRRTLNQL